MGGNAMEQFSNMVKKKRCTKEEYTNLATEAVARLRTALNPGHGPVQFLVEPVRSYNNKRTYGDLDLLVSVPDSNDAHVFHVHDKIRRLFNPVVVLNQINSNTISFSYRSFQVDVLMVPASEFWFARTYFAYNDLGNLMGRIADGAGFKLGHNGLWYKLYYDVGRTQLIDTLLVTRNPEEALDFLGYDYDKHEKGFETLTDVFEYARSTKYFDSTLFLLESRNYKARVRDRKRKTYMAFLEQIKYWNEQAQAAEAAGRKVTKDWQKPRGQPFFWIERADRFWPEFRQRCEWKLREYEDQKLFKERLSGDTIGRVLGMEPGPKLGETVRLIRAHAEKSHKFLLLNPSTPDAMVDHWIKLAYNQVNK